MDLYEQSLGLIHNELGQFRALPISQEIGKQFNRNMNLYDYLYQDEGLVPWHNMIEPV